jgi:RNA polymerase sigma-70 factor (ECF subfamily)
MKSNRFETLVNTHKDAIYRQMLRVCGHREDAEDALGLALLQAFRAADDLRETQNFAAWVATIGRRVCFKMRGHPSVHQAYDFALDRALVDGSSDDMDLAVMKTCIQEAFEQLPEKYREIYVRCEIEEQTLPEAAEAMGISVAAAKSRLHRARAMVRSLLDTSICGTAPA